MAKSRTCESAGTYSYRCRADEIPHEPGAAYLRLGQLDRCHNCWASTAMSRSLYVRTLTPRALNRNLIS